MVVPELSDPNDECTEALVPRRCSARIKSLKTEQEAQRARCRPIDDPALQKKAKVCKKRKVDSPSQSVDNDVTATNVAVPNDCTHHPVPQASQSPHLSGSGNGNGNEKSSHVRVTETIRRFNKHYLHFVQEEEIRCGGPQADQEKKKSKSKEEKIRCRGAQADKKKKKNSKSKGAKDDGKRSSKRPDLKAISK
ncbi:hypothetical protein HAX54_029421 [Datura stramonium]|uniref:Uncharacterized protein n=1 Tax=Datura stramonium TaxID=4076 RepID=A0ABS8SA65_DATST|nr:hypothetical protein [Datura stramonium]